MTTAGDLRSKVAFYKRASPTPPPPDYGQAEGEWSPTPEFECAAHIMPRLGGEQVLAARLTGVTVANITVRQSNQTVQVTTAWKVVDARTNVEYNIRSIIDPHQGAPQQGAFFELLCQTGVPT